MTEVYVGLLRAINVGGRRKVAMADLQSFFTKLGFENPQTLLQSGNLLFGADRGSIEKMERRLETEAGQQINLHTDFMVRSAAEWRRIIEGNPFTEAAEEDPSHLVVMFLKKAPDAAAVKALQSAVRGPEEVRVVGSEAYITYPDGIGRSKLTTSLIESKLGTRGTGRNWNTVLKLGEMLAE